MEEDPARHTVVSSVTPFARQLDTHSRWHAQGRQVLQLLQLLPALVSNPFVPSPSFPALPDIASCGSADRDRLRCALRDEMAKVYFAVSDNARLSMRSPNDAAVAIEGT